MKRFLFLASALLLTCTGCAREYGGHRARYGRAACTGVATADLVLGAYELGTQLASSAPGDHDDILDLPDPVQVEYVPVAPLAPQRYAPPEPPPPPGPRAFDLNAAQSSLAAVDVDACKADGLATGYGHATVAFAPDGTVQGVALDLPSPTSPAARACIESAFKTPHVAPFSGGQVMNVRRSFYVS